VLSSTHGQTSNSEYLLILSRLDLKNIKIINEMGGNDKIQVDDIKYEV